MRVDAGVVVNHEMDVGFAWFLVHSGTVHIVPTDIVHERAVVFSSCAFFSDVDEI